MDPQDTPPSVRPDGVARQHIFGRWAIEQEGDSWIVIEIVNPELKIAHVRSNPITFTGARKFAWYLALRRCTNEEIIHRWPRIVAHLICESLGYFTPTSAAGAVSHVKANRAYWCEWYCHMAQGYDDDKILKVGKQTLLQAIKGRHRHSGYMAEYRVALGLVMAEKERSGSTSGMLASWF